MAEQAALVGRPERRAAPELAHPADVVEERGGEQEVGTQPLVQLRRLAHERRHADGVLEQPAGVRVVGLGRRQLAQRLPDLGVAEELRRRRRAQPRDGRPRPPGTRGTRRARRRRGAAAARAPPDRSSVASTERISSWSRSSKRSTRPSTRTASPSAKRPSSSSTSFQIRAFDPPGRIDELEREVRRALPRRPPLLARDGVDALDGAVGGELGDGAHAVSLGRGPVGTLPAMAVVKPFRALRYDEAVAGPLETLVAPPYDVITDEQREELRARSPYNVVRLTLPDSEEEAARDARRLARGGRPRRGAAGGLGARAGLRRPGRGRAHALRDRRRR